MFPLPAARVHARRVSPIRYVLKNLREHFITLGVFLVRIGQAEDDRRLVFEKMFACAVIGEFFSNRNIADAEPIKFPAAIIEVGKKLLVVSLFNRDK